MASYICAYHSFVFKLLSVSNGKEQKEKINKKPVSAANGTASIKPEKVSTAKPLKNTRTNLIKVSFRPFVALRYKSVEKSQERVTSGVVCTCKARYLHHPGSQEEEETSAIKLSDQQLLEKHHQPPGSASSSVVRHSIRTCSKMRVIGRCSRLRPRLPLREHALWDRAPVWRDRLWFFSSLVCRH